jgi:hypothetical protein
LLDAIIALINNPQITRRVDRHAARPTELSIAATESADRSH